MRPVQNFQNTVAHIKYIAMTEIIISLRFLISLILSFSVSVTEVIAASIFSEIMLFAKLLLISAVRLLYSCSFVWVFSAIRFINFFLLIKDLKTNKRANEALKINARLTLFSAPRRAEASITAPGKTLNLLFHFVYKITYILFQIFNKVFKRKTF